MKFAWSSRLRETRIPLVAVRRELERVGHEVKDLARHFEDHGLTLELHRRADGFAAVHFDRVALAIPAGLVLMYFVFTAKATKRIPPPKVTEFRIGKQVEDKAAKKYTVDLLWDTENADTVTIEPLIGKVEQKGTTPVTIAKTETFVLKAENAAGKVEFSLEIEMPTK